MGMIEPLDHGVHREKHANLSVVSVRYLWELCAKFFAFCRPHSWRFVKGPG